MEDPLSDHLQNIQHELKPLYDNHEEVFSQIQNLIQTYKNHTIIREKNEQKKGQPVLCEKDCFLITYANSVVKPNEKPLKTLQQFLREYVGDTFSGIHILPFFPSSSDGGFSVVDFRSVDENFGDWDDIQALGEDYRLMADLVLNHVSVKSEWFQQFLAGNPKYQDYFLAYDEPVDTSNVFRPRVHPLLTPFTTASGETKHVWTTFSQDQVDLNFAHPEVLIEMLDVMLFYLSKGIEGIRLDAVGYAWKDLERSSIHLPETHAIVRILRSVMEEVAPYAFLISETNVPYEDNISYMGNGSDEVHMVYGFDVPPLVAHAFLTEDASRIKQFCKTTDCEKNVLFFQFLASHDGIGLLGAENILSDKEVEELNEEMIHRGGYVSYKARPHMPPKPYEMNITYFDAINKPHEESYEANDRFLASQAFMLALKGVPGVYIHSLLASRNNAYMSRETGIKRLINRAKLDWDMLKMALDEDVSRRAQVLKAFKQHLAVRKNHPALSPYALQHVIRKNKKLFIVERTLGDDTMTVVINITQEVINIPEYNDWFDEKTQTKCDGTVEPYQVLYLTQ